MLRNPGRHHGRPDRSDPMRHVEKHHILERQPHAPGRLAYIRLERIGGSGAPASTVIRRVEFVHSGKPPLSLLAIRNVADAQGPPQWLHTVPVVDQLASPHRSFVRRGPADTVADVCLGPRGKERGSAAIIGILVGQASKQCERRTIALRGRGAQRWTTNAISPNTASTTAAERIPEVAKRSRTNGSNAMRERLTTIAR